MKRYTPLDENSEVNVEFHPHNHTEGLYAYQTIGSLIEQSPHNAIIADTNHFPFYRQKEQEIKKFGGANLGLKERIEGALKKNSDMYLKRFDFEFFCNDDIIKATARRDGRIVWAINALEYGATKEVLIYPRIDLGEKIETATKNPEIIKNRQERDIQHIKEVVLSEVKKAGGFSIAPHIGGVIPEGLELETLIDFCESGFKFAATAGFNSRNWYPGGNAEAKRVAEVLKEKYDIPIIYESDSAIKDSNRAYNLINTRDFNPETECERNNGKYFIKHLGETISSGKFRTHKVGSGRFAGLSNPLPLGIILLSSLNNLKLAAATFSNK